MSHLMSMRDRLIYEWQIILNLHEMGNYEQRLARGMLKHYWPEECSRNGL